jgi:hypothetical protein
MCPREVKEGIWGLELISSKVRKWMQLINIDFFLCGILLLTVEHSSFLTVVQDGEFCR